MLCLTFGRRYNARYFPGPKKASLFMRSPSRIEVVILWVLSAVIFVIVISHFQSITTKVDTFGDNGAYLEAAHAIHNWNFQNVTVKQFWGLSYGIALLSFVPKLSDRTSLLLICSASSLVSVLLAYQLWGAWVAGYFAVINFDWMQRSYLGGSEPLFVALLFGSFVCIRKGRWVWASVLAALASVVRPLGIFALLAIGIVLLFRREYCRLVSCTAVGAVIGLLYLLPFWFYFHDPLYQFHRYQKSDWHSGPAVSLPFQALASSFLHNTEPLSNVVLTLGWVLFVLTGLLAMTRRSFRPFVNQHRAELLFVFFYLVFLFTYNSGWARAEFPRFAIPLVPFILVALEPWVPKSRVVLYTVCIIGSALAASSAIGIRNVLPGLR
jgi:glycosyl transferase family 87